MPDQEDPFIAWDTFATGHEAGDVITAPVTKVVPFGAFVRLAETIEGLLHREHLDRPPAVGDRISVRIDEIDRTRRRVVLSAA